MFFKAFLASSPGIIPQLSIYAWMIGRSPSYPTARNRRKFENRLLAPTQSNCNLCFQRFANMAAHWERSTRVRLSIVSGRRQRKKSHKSASKKREPLYIRYSDDPFLNKLFVLSQQGLYSTSLTLLLSIVTAYGFGKSLSIIRQLLVLSAVYSSGSLLIRWNTIRRMEDPIYYAKTLLWSMRLSSLCGIIAVGIMLESGGLGRKVIALLIHSGIGPVLSKWITTLGTIAFSGVVGNFCYDVIKTRILAKYRKAKGDQPQIQNIPASLN